MTRDIKKLYILFFILFLTPTPPFKIGSFFPIIGSLSLFIYLLYEYFIRDGKKIPIDIKFDLKNNYLILLIFLYFIWEVFLLFFQPISLSNLSYTLRPIYFLSVFFSTALVSSELTEEELKEHLMIILKLMFFFQIVIVILQLFDINVFSYFYQDDKSFPLGRLVRVTGTFGNPNIFAWHITQFTVMMLILKDNKGHNVRMLLISFILVLLSGSRTMLIITPVIWIFTLVLKYYLVNRNIKVVFYGIGSFLIFIIIIFSFLNSTKNIFPYASQILNVLKGGLKSVNSFNLRVGKWKETIEFMHNNRLVYFIGFSTRSYSSLDNDILYGISRSGIIGLILQYAIFILLFFKNRKKSNSYKVIFLFQYILFALLLGLQAETLTGWIYPVVYLFFLGLEKEVLISND